MLTHPMRRRLPLWDAVYLGSPSWRMWDLLMCQICRRLQGWILSWKQYDLVERWRQL